MLEDRQPCQKKILASVLGPQLRFQKNLIGLLVYPQQTTFLYGNCIRCPQSPLTYHLPKALPSF
jgi:hypothetical protein